MPTATFFDTPSGSATLACGQERPIHLLERDQDFRTIQELQGHKNVMTTMIYTH